MPRSSRWPAARAWWLLLFFASCRGGCGRPASEADRLLASLPAGTRFVVSIDVARIRASALWSRVTALAQQSPDDERRLARLAARTGLDPLRQIHRVVAAFPDDARTHGEFALIVDGAGFDEARLVAFAREESGAKLEGHAHGARTLWSAPSAPGTAGFFVGHDRFVLGAGGWAATLAELADGKSGVASAAGNSELRHLLGGGEARRALWAAAVVPLDVRQILMADAKAESAGSVTRLAAGADLGPALTASVVAELSNAADARALEARLQATVRESKRNAKLLMLGLGPYLDALQIHAEGPTLRLQLALSEQQTKDLLERAAGLYRLARERRGR